MLHNTSLRHDALHRLRRSKVRGVLVRDTSPLRHDLGSDEIARDVDQSTETVDEPVDGNDDCVHACDGDADGLGDDEGEDQRGAGDGGRGDGGKGREEDDDDVVAGVERHSLGGGEEDDDGGEVDGGSVHVDERAERDGELGD